MALGNVVYTSDFPWNFSLLPVPIGVLSFGKDLPVFQPSLMHHSSCLHPPETKQSIGHQLAFKLKRLFSVMPTIWSKIMLSIMSTVLFDFLNKQSWKHCSNGKNVDIAAAQISALVPNAHDYFQMQICLKRAKNQNCNLFHYYSLVATLIISSLNFRY